ncbi:arginine-tRNA-protein transferase [Ampelomyces quisqualis]|uniref:Arginine-tRNA-protein transferase n=1 Tax=Ampelomyces quisqualis TaxID=50730 RepID=A0A6A5QMD3_AMPQU|nr:arginine-tRNA-protein transferase [Ampelomyces quisqualis]
MQSRVTPFGYSSESCGYCKDASNGQRRPHSRAGASYYFSSKLLTVECYQTLVDRGWRRSGTIFYKPDVLRHCCPHYTIRKTSSSLVQAIERPTTDCQQMERLRTRQRLQQRGCEASAYIKTVCTLKDTWHSTLDKS